MKKKLLFIFLTVMIPFYSSAWGLLGHRIVGDIADRHINAKTRKKIQEILGNESMAMSANWGDFIKSDPAYNYLGPWHYVNLPSGLSASQVDAYLKKDSTVSAYTQIPFLIRQLKDKTLPRQMQLIYLRLLIHIVGDLSQPMHTGRLKDLGGNRIKLYWFNSSTNLHRIWDEQLIEYQQLSYTEYVGAINHATKTQVKSWQSGGINDWIWESYQIAEKLYANVKVEERLSYSYNFRYVETLNAQLLKGGIRLAGVLNDVFAA